jgi:hypothetical protein
MRAYMVTVTQLLKNGMVDRAQRPISRTFPPLPDHDADTTRQAAEKVWVDAGSPPHAYITVEIRETVARFEVEGTAWTLVER